MDPALREWKWIPAWLLTHQPEPPFQHIGRKPPKDMLKPLTRLADQSWVAAAIAYTKDVAVLQEAEKRGNKGGSAEEEK